MADGCASTTKCARSWATNGGNCWAAGLRTSSTRTTSETGLANRSVLLAGDIGTIIREKRCLRRDGGVVWASLAVFLLRDAEGRPERMVAIVEDITQRRLAEEELCRLTGRLEDRVREEVAAREVAQARAAHAERMQALGQMAGGIAHDFNNVLQGVLGAATLIERRPGDEDGVRRLARLAVEASERGASVTRRLLAFGRQADLRAEAFEAAPLLSGLQEILAHTIGAGIEVSVSIGADCPPLFADRVQLETALLNLATNARDAMPCGGRLALSATCLRCSPPGLAARALRAASPWPTPASAWARPRWRARPSHSSPPRESEPELASACPWPRASPRTLAVPLPSRAVLATALPSPSGFPRPRPAPPPA